MFLSDHDWLLVLLGQSLDPKGVRKKMEKVRGGKEEALHGERSGKGEWGAGFRQKGGQAARTGPAHLIRDLSAIISDQKYMA